MSTNALHRFLTTFVAAHHSQQAYVVVRRSGAALQCLSIFLRWGLISHCTDGGRRWGSPRSRRPAQATPDRRSITVWLNPRIPTTTGAHWERGRVAGTTHALSGHGHHRLEMVYRPTLHQRAFRSHRWIRGRLAHFNSLYLIRSSRGIITSQEALRHRLGGTLLLILHL
jgi:hypothetical protein